MLNGQTVVENFEDLAGLRPLAGTDSLGLSASKKRTRRGRRRLSVVSSVSGVALEREVLVLGYNHNLQDHASGVTKDAMIAIRDWVAESVHKYLG